jgi:hypothetical protein
VSVDVHPLVAPETASASAHRRRVRPRIEFPRGRDARSAPAPRSLRRQDLSDLADSAGTLRTLRT